jgi:hypothetical protein
MKKPIASFALSGVMLLTCLMTLILQGCDKESTTVKPRPQAVSGCTDRAAENYDPLATEPSDFCVYSRDKFIGTYTIQSLECSGPYGGIISQFGTLKISIAPFESRPELVSILFPENADAFFGTGRISGSELRALSTRTSTGADHAELNAAYHNGMLYGRFDITGADQSNTEKIATCHFVARKTQ